MRGEEEPGNDDAGSVQAEGKRDGQPRAYLEESLRH